MIGLSEPGLRRAIDDLRLWRQRNGLSFPRFTLPGIVHQGWGWYDALDSFAAALVAGGAALFLLATAVYLVAAGVGSREPPQAEQLWRVSEFSVAQAGQVFIGRRLPTNFANAHEWGF